MDRRAKEAYFLLEGDSRKLPGEAEAFARRLRAVRVDGAPGFTKITYRVFDSPAMLSHSPALSVMP